jgi:hypothetical protein
MIKDKKLTSVEKYYDKNTSVRNNSKSNTKRGKTKKEKNSDDENEEDALWNKKERKAKK